MKQTADFPLIDAHCHLDFPEFDADRAEVIQRAYQNNVKAFVVPGITSQQWGRLIELLDLKQQFSHTKPLNHLSQAQTTTENLQSFALAFGLHPYFIEQHVPQDLLVLEQLLQALPSAAVGEIGLDATCSQPAFQAFLLQKQLKLARRYQRPVILHHRKTQPALLAQIKACNLQQHQQLNQKPPLTGMLHAFSGSYEQGMAWVQLGFMLGVGGTITYERAQKTRRAIQKLPLSHLVLETDSPDMPLSREVLGEKTQGLQENRNEPANCARVFEVLCQLRSESPAEIAAQLYKNTLSLFPKISIL